MCGKASGNGRVSTEVRPRALARLGVQSADQPRLLQHDRPRARLPRRRRRLPPSPQTRRTASAGEAHPALAPPLVRLAPDRRGPERRLRLPPARPREPEHHPPGLRPTCSGRQTTPWRRERRWRRATRPWRAAADREAARPGSGPRFGGNSGGNRPLRRTGDGAGSLLIANGLNVVFGSRQLGLRAPVRARRPRGDSP